ncbi:cytochrome c oxidase subunit II [Nocardioides pantholopis]|uniref:aa3-type cytochrome oxidase subunit II n=1 Tax=Nocardioides pantholopis TaxID=2483798 RepID=UPI001F4939E6|nr:cytochrome c oxidase subunit II [Nocardioides pantholopis]
MSLQSPRRGTTGAVRRVLLPIALGAGALALAGCSSQSRGEWERLAMPEPATEQGEHTLSLWQGAWTAALLVGLLVWGLIFFVVWRYRRRRADEIPVQTRYNLPLEIFYTIAPILMVVVFFSHTIKTQNEVLHESAEPDNVIEVTAQQWSWTFNYGVGKIDYANVDDPADEKFPYPEYASVVGDASTIPTLYLPVGETIRFNLHSPDVIHDFGVPGFLMKMDVIPGRVNHFEITPKSEGTYAGKCYELCGVYHSRMLFNVEIVSPEEYDAYVESLAAQRVSDGPLLGGENSDTQTGLVTEEDPEGEGN